MLPVPNFHRSDINASSNAQDILEKRRRQIERAKAANLSKQLQMRLQYARLKVEHGWQKQTLNEVENLYFHHYRAKNSSPELNRTPKPKKNQSRDRVNPSVHAPKGGGNAVASDQAQSVITTKESSLTKDSSTSDAIQIATDIKSATTLPDPSAVELGVVTDVPMVANSNSVSSTLVPYTTGTDNPTVSQVAESSTYPATVIQTQPQSQTSHSPENSPTSPSLNVPIESQSQFPTSMNAEKTSVSPPSPATQAQNSIAKKSTSTAQTKTPLPTSPFASMSSSPSSSTSTTELAVKSTITRSPSKLPIPRLPASSYPYAITTSSTSPGKTRKGTSTVVNSGAPRPLPPSSLPVTSPPPPLLSPYKSPYTPTYPLSHSSSSTALQSTPSLAGNSGGSLPLTYDSFWSSHTSTSSLPLSYRSNINANFSFTSGPSLSTLPINSSTLASSSGNSSGPSTSQTTLASTPSSNFPFTSSLTSINNSNPSSSTSLSHSPIVSSLLHPQGLPLFQQVARSPPVVGGANQNTQVG